MYTEVFMRALMAFGMVCGIAGAIMSLVRIFVRFDNHPKADMITHVIMCDGILIHAFAIATSFTIVACHEIYSTTLIANFAATAVIFLYMLIIVAVTALSVSYTLTTHKLTKAKVELEDERKKNSSKADEAEEPEPGAEMLPEG